MDLGNPRPPNLPSARPNSSNEAYWKKVGLLRVSGTPSDTEVFYSSYSIFGCKLIFTQEKIGLNPCLHHCSLVLGNFDCESRSPKDFLSKRRTHRTRLNKVTYEILAVFSWKLNS